MFVCLKPSRYQQAYSLESFLRLSTQTSVVGIWTRANIAVDGRGNISDG